jgi:hypothetical protein
MATTEPINHVVISPGPGEMGYGCKCGQRFPTKKTADAHAADQNLIEENEAKAKAQQQAGANAPAAQSNSGDAGENDTAPVAPQTSTGGGEIASAEGQKPEEPTGAPAKEIAPDEKAQPPTVQPSTSTSSETPQSLSPSNLPLDLENLSLNQINFIGQTMAKSGMFPDVTDGAKALVKILAGKEIGVTPFQAMTNIHIIQGKATMGANLMAAKVKGSGKYDYRVMDLTSETCSILFKQRDSLAEGGWADLGKFTYSLEDAKRAGLLKAGSSWEKYPSNMLFARAISSGVRIYCPDVFKGNLVYVPEELGAQVNEDGEPIGRAA